MAEKAKLVVVSHDKNENGFSVEVTKKYPVFVREKSVTRSEYYEALRTGITTKLILEMRAEDWELSAHTVSGKKEYATRIEYDGYTYDVVRHYATGKAMVQVTCS